MIRVKYAMGTDFVNLHGGGRVRVVKGSHWAADDPAVEARPELFSDDPRWGMQYTSEPDGYDAPVETASAAPGERRSVRRTS